MVDFADGVWFRPMTQVDVPAVLAIIADYDEDDAEDASRTFQADLLGYFVSGRDTTIMGVTGATPIDGTDSAYILGWTHVADGLGTTDLRDLVGELASRLTEDGGRKLFAEISDYIDPQHGDISAPFRRALMDLGFIEELRHASYYEDREAQIIYSLRLREPVFDSPAPDHREVRLTDIDEIDDTEGSFWLSWELDDAAVPLVREDFQKIIDQVRQWNGRSVFIAFPGGIPAVDAMMQRAGFRFDGRLSDFYADGIDDLRFRYDL